MESPLSFDSTENFRKKLLVRNLPPYKVQSAFSTGDVPASNEIILVDYAIKDSPSVESIANNLEKGLYLKNQYGPSNEDGAYGEMVSINVNLGTKTNEGEYGFPDSINSLLEQIGDRQEGLLYVKNLYGPVGIGTSYGDTININNTFQTNTNLGNYGYPLTFGSKLERIGDNQETVHIVRNVYKPVGQDQYGDTVWYINDDEVIRTTGEGEYTIEDTFNSYLYQIGNQQEIFHKVRNLYKPEQQEDYGNTVWYINDDQTIRSMGAGIYTITDTLKSYLFQIGNKQEIFHKTKNVYKPGQADDYGNTVWYINNDQVILTTGSGLYGRDDADDSYLSRYGNQQEIFHKVKNIYRPNYSKDFGDPAYWINNDETILTNGSGEYAITDTINSYLYLIGNEKEEDLLVLNKYTPGSSQGYGDTRYDLNNLQVLGSNEGIYDFSDTINSQLEIIGQVRENFLYVINKYGPKLPSTQVTGSYGNSVNINQNIPLGTNEGEYDINDTIDSPLENVGEFKEKQAYVINKYVSGTGKYGNPELVTIDDLQISTYGLPYSDSDGFPSTYLPSTYTPFSILLSENPSGSDGSLSQDSALAQIGARQLNKEFKFRVAAELFQQTLARVNVLDSSIDPDTGEISSKPNTDPFDAIGLLAGQIPLYAKDYTITNPDLFLGQAINFAARLAGTYSPYSFIPGEYFDYPDKKGSAIFTNPLSIIGGAIGGVFRLLQPKNQSASELFVEFTSVATRGLLYDQLRYNVFRPDYKIGTDLLAPQGNYYIGKRKSEITEIVSPDGELPESKIKGVAAKGPVFSYGKIGQEYEGEQMNRPYTGLNSRPYIDSLNGVQGGFTWISRAGRGKENWMIPGNYAGPGGSVFSDDSEFNFSQISSTYEPTQSTLYEFTNGSILDVTQKLVDAGNRSNNKLEHVGNAINQVSKVFNDGYIELTKGSRVIRYTTKNSVPENSNTPTGYEYCRVFTKDRPYMDYDELQKTDGNIRKYSYSVLDNTFNLNIAPWKGKESTNIVNDKVKKYMFSLENLAWRTSNKPGFTYEDLPACEKGPNGGRIMWFPPYDVTYDDSSTTTWTDNNFLGRPEPIYTFNSSSRSGKLNWTILVDHPSILNVIVDKELENESSDSVVNKVLTSFFAGCTKYDLYDLVKKFPMFTPSDVFEVQKDIYQPDDLIYFIEGTTSEETEVITTQVNIDQPSITIPPVTAPPITVPPVSAPPPSVTPTITQPPPKLEKPVLGELLFFFHNDYPLARDFPGTPGYRETNEDYFWWLNAYKALKPGYLKKYPASTLDKGGHYFKGALNYIFEYGDITRAGKTGDVLKSPAYEQKTYMLQYIDTRIDEISKFFNYIDEKYKEINTFFQKLCTFLKQGGECSFTIEGSASAIQTPEYNNALAARRINSIRQYIDNFTYDGVSLKQAIAEGKLIIKDDIKGEAVDIQDPDYKNINCTEPFKYDSDEGNVSVNAMACRRVRIRDVDPRIKQDAQTQPQVTEEEIPSVIPGTQEFTDVVPPQQLAISVPNNPRPTPVTTTITTTKVTPPKEVRIKQEPVERQRLVQRTDLTKRLARKLLTECNYFELVKQTDPMVYSSLRSKLKYFHPAFHSITPEGLNARLTFLNQCMRPGDTIPTVNKDNNGRVSLIYNDVTNSVFGAPPVCVLRFGDFYHSKIVIESMSFTYEEIPYDLNPEGIGIQPMLAKVSMSFKFIGGHGMAGPVAKLQNALSFNYYANTEMYDDRAEITEDVASQYDAELLKAIKDEIGIVDDPNKQRTDTKGDTIGTITVSNFDLNTNKAFGNIQYKDVMNKLADQTKSYATTVLNNLEKVNESYLLGGILIFTNERKFTEGYFDWLTGNTSQVGYIYGKSEQIQNKIEKLVKKAKQDVDDDLCPLIDVVINYNFTNQDIRKIKKQIQKLIDEEGEKMLALLEGCNSAIVSDELNLVFTIDKINYVASGVDGYINQKGNPLVFNLTGGTAGIDPNTNAPNSFVELKIDFLKIKTQLNNFINKLETEQVIPTGSTYTYNDQFAFDSFIDTDPNNIDASENRFFMLFGKVIITDGTKFTDKIVDDAIPSASEEVKTQWKQFFSDKLNVGNEALIPNYTRSKEIVDGRFKKFKDNYFTNTFNTFNPYNRTVPRLMSYGGQVPITGTNGSNLEELWSDQNSSGDKYNLKKTFK